MGDCGVEPGRPSPLLPLLLTDEGLPQKVYNLTFYANVHFLGVLYHFPSVTIKDTPTVSLFSRRLLGGEDATRLGCDFSISENLLFPYSNL